MSNCGHLRFISLSRLECRAGQFSKLIYHRHPAVSQVTFAFKVTPALLALAIGSATVIGLGGGLFPAIRAARLSIASGLRES